MQPTSMSSAIELIFCYDEAKNPKCNLSSVPWIETIVVVGPVAGSEKQILESVCSQAIRL